MNAKQVQAEIESTLMRNFSILKDDAEASEDVRVDARGFVLLHESKVHDMLKACAANLAQIYADRVVDE